MSQQYYHRGKAVTVTMKYSNLWIFTGPDGSISNDVPGNFSLVQSLADSSSSFVPIPDQTVLRINDEETTADDIANAIHGIGPRRAKQILSNRPKTGYLSWDHFKIECGLKLDWGNVEASMREMNVTVEY